MREIGRAKRAENFSDHAHLNLLNHAYSLLKLLFGVLVIISLRRLFGVFKHSFARIEFVTGLNIVHFDSNYARQSSIQVKTRPITCFVHLDHAEDAFFSSIRMR